MCSHGYVYKKRLALGDLRDGELIAKLTFLEFKVKEFISEPVRQRVGYSTDKAAGKTFYIVLLFYELPAL